MDRDLSDNVYKPSKSAALGDSQRKNQPTRGPDRLELRRIEVSKGGSSKSSSLGCCWKKLSDRIEANHSARNLGFHALTAQLPLKDSVHMRFHEVASGDQLKTKPNIDSMPGQTSLKVASPHESLHQEQLRNKEISTAALREASFETVLRWATESKISSLQLQQFSQTCPDDCVSLLLGLVEKHSATLLTHKYGSYLVQKLIPRCSSNLSRLIRYCKHHFAQLAKNEFSSRVLQKLIEHSPAFCAFAMSTFKSDLELYTKDVASGYLVAAGILQARSEVERDILSDYLRFGKSKWYDNKYAKKIIIVYLAACSPNHLDTFFHSLQIAPNLLLFMQDKHSCNILLTFLTRRHAMAQSLVLRKLMRNPLPLIRTKFFGFFIAELSRLSQTSELVAEIGSVLRTISQENFRALLNEAVSYQIFSGAVSLIYASQSS